MRNFIRGRGKYLLLGGAGGFLLLSRLDRQPTVSLPTALEELRQGNLGEVEVRQWKSLLKNQSQQVLLTLRSGSRLRLAPQHLEELLASIEREDRREVSVRIQPARTMLPLVTLCSFAGLGLLLLLVLRGRKRGAGEGGFSLQTLFAKEKTFLPEKDLKTRLSDVAGVAEAKLEVSEFVDFLKHPQRYRDMGAKLPKGALLTGPPGTGKTLLTRAIAGESGVAFFSVSGAEFVEMFVGVGASRVRKLFQSARAEKRAIVFIDEIDAIGKKRAEKFGSSEHDSTLNQLLVEMDGFSERENVIVFAATNRSELLDPALLRPGRFDRLIDVPLPDIDGRAEIAGIHLARLRLDGRPAAETARRLAALTPGFSGADIASVCNEAALLAARRGRAAVGAAEFESAVERVIGGVEKARLPSPEERRRVAIHECGHAVSAWFLAGAAPLLKLTIVPRSKGALGFAQYLSNESMLQTRAELMDQIVFTLGGRWAELLLLGDSSTGASDDLVKANRVAWAAVAELGMSALGPVSLQTNAHGVKGFSEATNRAADLEVREIVQRCSERCRELLAAHRAELERLAAVLLERETLTLGEIEAVLGPRPFAPRASFKQYLETAHEAGSGG